MATQFRFTLHHRASSSSTVINNPFGWKGATRSLDRHPEFHSLIESYKGSFQFYGTDDYVNGGREWLKNIEKTYGPNAEVEQVVDYINNEFDLVWKNFFTGTITIGKFRESLQFAHYLDAQFDPQGFWTKFIKRFETPVNLQSATDLDGNSVPSVSPLNIKLPSQIINKLNKYTGHSGEVETLEDVYCATYLLGNVALNGPDVIDGIFTSDGMRVLVKNQTDAKENGTYIVNHSGPWSRTEDANTGTELEDAIVKVSFGVNNAGTVWKQHTNPVTIGVSNIVWDEYNYVDDVIIYEEGVGIDNAESTLTVYTVATLNPEIQEITRTFAPGFDSTLDYNELSESVEIQQERGEVTIDIDHIDLSLQLDGILSGGGVVLEHQWSVKLYVRINDDSTILLDTDAQNFSAPVSYPKSFSLSGTYTFNALPSDRITLIIQYNIRVDLDAPGGHWESRSILGGITDELINITFKSKIADSTGEGFFIHDEGSLICDRIAGESGLFYSEYLGNADTCRTYDQVGCASNYATIKGLQARGYLLSEKSSFMSMKDWFEGVDPHFNIGLGYSRRVIDDYEQNVIEVRQKKDFYRADTLSIVLLNVKEITRAYEDDMFFTSAELGSEKWESEDVSGLDDPQTKRIWSFIYKNFGKPFERLSKFIAASLAFETTRRQRKTFSADWKYDNEDFLLSIVKEGSSYKPRLNEGFSDVTGLSNSDTRYNKDLTPARAFIRWLDYLSCCMQWYLTDSINFASGEGNYDMSSTMDGTDCSDSYSGQEVSEKGDFLPSTEPLFIPMPYTIKAPFTIEQWTTVNENRDLAIGISPTDSDPKKFVIKSLDYKESEGTVSIVAYPKTLDDIIDITPQFVVGGRFFDDTFGPEFN